MSPKEVVDEVRNSIVAKVLVLTLGGILVAAATGTWSMSMEFAAVKEQLESVEEKIASQDRAIDRNRDRIQYIRRRALEERNWNDESR